MNAFLTASSSSSSSQSGVVMIIWIAAMVALIYFMMIRPQRKETKRVNAMLADMAVGDSVVTTSGFYGVLLDITDEDVIVEFGNNKNCRIPMKKAAIAQVEKAQTVVTAAPAKEEKPAEEKKD
jgi:preprotein translocase subunit YajC